MKICTKCGIEKEDSEFYQDKRRKDGLTSTCKQCSNNISREWRIHNHEKFITYHRDRLQNGQDYVNSLKSPCIKCGEKRLYVLQFHHINPENKVFELGSTGVFKSKSRIKNEVDKCVCLCANCHTEYHWLYGKRPEQPVETLTEYLGRSPYEI